MSVYVRTFHFLHIIGKFESSLFKLVRNVPNSNLYLMHGFYSSDTFEKVEYKLFLLLQLLPEIWISCAERNHAFGIKHWETPQWKLICMWWLCHSTRSVTFGSKQSRPIPTRLYKAPYAGSMMVWMMHPNVSGHWVCKKRFLCSQLDGST